MTQKDDDDYQGKGETLPDNEDKDYRDAAQPVKPAFGGEDDYDGVGVTRYAPAVAPDSDEAMDDASEAIDYSVRLLVIGGGILNAFYVVAIIGEGWIEEDIEATTVCGNIDDIDIDDPPEQGLWLFTGKVVAKKVEGYPGDVDVDIHYEGEYTRPKFHEVLAFGTEWGPVPEGVAPPVPTGAAAPI